MNALLVTLLLAGAAPAVPAPPDPVRVTLMERVPGRDDVPADGSSAADGVRLGQRVLLTARIEAPEGTRLTSIDAAETGSDFELIVDARAGATDAGPFPLDVPLAVVPFQIGDLSFPGVRVAWQAPDGTTGASRSGAWPVSVVATIDNVAKAKPADIRGPVDLPVPWPVRLLAGVAAAALGLGGIVWLLWRRRRRGHETGAELPPADPYDGLAPAEWALRELDRLLADGVLARQGIEPFHVALSDIVRRYVHGAHGVDTAESTTTEILGAVEAALQPPPVARQGLRQVLMQCDLVKFARVHPGDDAARSGVERARQFVETTRPVADPVPLAPEAT
ncbi:MAG: hypothetical protein ACE5IK_00920 [Acidobacteriota bacterium]